jgi:predicted nucleic acid-binding protein
MVVDNSMALAWTLEDEHSASADAVLESVMQEGGHVPFIFRAEFANGLTMAGRRGRIGSGARSEALAFIETLQLAHDLPTPDQVAAAMDLADEYVLTVYDALYLELARRRHLPLATLDNKLAGAARKAGLLLAAPPGLEREA